MLVQIDSIVFCLFMAVDVKYYKQLAPIVFPPVKKNKRPKSSTPNGESESLKRDAPESGVPSQEKSDETDKRDVMNEDTDAVTQKVDTALLQQSGSDGDAATQDMQVDEATAGKETAQEADAGQANGEEKGAEKVDEAKKVLEAEGVKEEQETKEETEVTEAKGDNGATETKEFETVDGWREVDAEKAEEDVDGKTELKEGEKADAK